MKMGKTLDVRDRKAWRAWLEKNHASETEIWLVYWNKTSEKDSIGYDESVEEALCFGWIDGLIQKHGEHSHVRRFTPRKKKSIWSASNVERYARLKKTGLLAPAGRLAAPPAGEKGYRVSTVSAKGPPRDFLEALSKNKKARDHYGALAPGYQRSYHVFILGVKSPEARKRRVVEAIRRLCEGRKACQRPVGGWKK